MQYSPADLCQMADWQGLDVSGSQTRRRGLTRSLDATDGLR